MDLREEYKNETSVRVPNPESLSTEEQFDLLLKYCEWLEDKLTGPGQAVSSRKSATDEMDCDCWGCKTNCEAMSKQEQEDWCPWA